MRNLVVFLMSIGFIYNVQSQIYEVGIFAGGSNFIGDVGATKYINPSDPALGAIVKWNRSARHSYRASIIYSDLKGVDANSDDPRRVARNYTFDSNLLEIALGMEFSFWDFNLNDVKPKIAPYLFSGITTARHRNYFFSDTGVYTDEGTTSWAFGIPMVLGVKTNITPHFILAAEIGARYTFSDELDGSVPDSEFKESLSFGNTNSNDWYVFSGLTLTYTFGRKPCHCYYEE